MTHLIPCSAILISSSLSSSLYLSLSLAIMLTNISRCSDILTRDSSISPSLALPGSVIMRRSELTLTQVATVTSCQLGLQFLRLILQLQLLGLNH